MSVRNALARSAREYLAELREPDSAVHRDHRLRAHRGAMAAVKAAVVVGVLDRRMADEHVAEAWMDGLVAMQSDGGLFTGGDNLASPPDAAFTIADAATVVALLRRHPTVAPRDGARALHVRLEQLVRSALPALSTGGIHTPNHRWEISAALAHAAELLGGEGADAALARAAQWLAEGVDADADAVYSERSPNYAAYVSNPSLLTLARVLDRPGLAELVHRSLHTTLDLTSPRGEVETVQSRRQDQHDGSFPLGPFLPQLAYFAACCDRCREAARLAATRPRVDAVDVLAQALVTPQVDEGLDAIDAVQVPAQVSPRSGERWFAGMRLLRWWAGEDWATVYGGSDVPSSGRIASGLACNPTFLRFALGEVEVRSVRLSRDFFAMGPFRATRVDRSSDRPGQVVLHEELVSGYYQPLPASGRRAGGDYAMEMEGRFAAAMSFSERRLDEMRLSTAVTVELLGQDRGDAVRLGIETVETPTVHALEIAFAEDVEISGATVLDSRRWLLEEDEVTVRRGGTTVRITASGGVAGLPASYHPGEAYSFLGGTDAVDGPRLYLTWRSPATTTVDFRRD